MLMGCVEGNVKQVQNDRILPWIRLEKPGSSMSLDGGFVGPAMGFNFHGLREFVSRTMI